MWFFGVFCLVFFWWFVFFCVCVVFCLFSILLFETEVKFIHIQEECELGLLLQSNLSSLKVEK